MYFSIILEFIKLFLMHQSIIIKAWVNKTISLCKNADMNNNDTSF